MATAAKSDPVYFDDDWAETKPVTSPTVLSAPNTPSPAKRLPPGKAWRPGQSGNPGGRPRYQPITDALKAELEREMPGADGKTVAEALAKRLIALAAGKSSAAIRALEVILDRAEGKVVQRQEVSGVDGAPMQFESLGNRQEVEARIAVLLMAAEERKGEPKTIEATVPPSPQPLNQIPMEPVEHSSNVAATGYDPAEKTLQVRYRNGGLYVWRGIIPQAEYRALRAAESAGGYMKGIEQRYGAGVKVDLGEMKPPAKTALDLVW